VKTTVPVLIALTVLSGPAAADSIGTTYDMDRMLSEPHPLANEYGSRWQQLQQRQPMPGMLYRPAVPPAPVLKPASPRSLPSPTAPPAPQAPAAPHHSPPVATQAAPPQLNFDAAGIDLELGPDEAALAKMEKIEMEKAGDIPQPKFALPPKTKEASGGLALPPKAQDAGEKNSSNPAPCRPCRRGSGIAGRVLPARLSGSQFA